MKTTFGEQLKKIRISRDMSQEELALLLGTSKQVISRYETNQRTPKITIVNEYALRLNVPLEYLLGDDTLSQPNILFPKNLCKIPVVGVIRAGEPILAIQNIEGYELADVPTPEDYFFLRVSGDSMINAGISEGDLILIRMQKSAENGQIVACILNGNEATLKKYRQQKDMVILQPENPNYEPIIVPVSDFESGYAQIIGVATELKRKLY